MNYRLLFSFFLLPACWPQSFVQALSAEDVFDDSAEHPYSSYVELGGIAGGVSETGQTSLFVPLWQTRDELLFADLRGVYNDLGESEGNWGLGYRRILNEETIFGAYGFYDMRRTQWNNRFHQATLGMELLRVDDEARWNVYIPNDREETTAPVAFVANNTINLAQGLEAAYFGTDFEYGYLAYSNDRKDVEVRAYLGGYAFDRGEQGYDSIIGPRARVELRLFDLPKLGNGSRLVLGGQYQLGRCSWQSGDGVCGSPGRRGRRPKTEGPETSDGEPGGAGCGHRDQYGRTESRRIDEIRQHGQHG